MTTYRVLGNAGTRVVLIAIDERAQVDRVDSFATDAGARLAKRELERGAAHIERHRTVGCRVQPGAPS